jgi:hypothetical protein
MVARCYLPIAFRRGLSHEDRERTREMRNQRQREDNKACVFYSSSVETMKEGMGRWTVALPHRHQAPPPFASSPSPRPIPFPPGGPAQTPHSARLDRSGPASCITGGEEVQYWLTARIIGKVVPEFKPAVSPPGLIRKLRPQLPLFNPSARAVVERDCHNESAVLAMGNGGGASCCELAGHHTAKQRRGAPVSRAHDVRDACWKCFSLLELVSV